MSSVFVLIMLFYGPAASRPGSTLTVEFNSEEKCEAARAKIASSHGDRDARVAFQGCFRK